MKQRVPKVERTYQKLRSWREGKDVDPIETRTLVDREKEGRG